MHKVFFLTFVKLNTNVVGSTYKRVARREQDSDVTALTRYVFYAEIGIR